MSINNSIKELKLCSSAAFLILMCLTNQSTTVKILDVLTPDVIKNGTEKYAIIDCIYNITEQDKDTLEVKWYFRHDPTPIYTWVPPNLPQVWQIYLQ